MFCFATGLDSCSHGELGGAQEHPPAADLEGCCRFLSRAVGEGADGDLHRRGHRRRLAVRAVEGQTMTDTAPIGFRRTAEVGLSLWLRPGCLATAWFGYTANPSTTLIGPGAGTTRRRRNPVRSKSRAYSARPRSRPPQQLTIICRSEIGPISRVVSSSTTVSTTRRRWPACITRRQLSRTRAARSSSQS